MAQRPQAGDALHDPAAGAEVAEVGLGGHRRDRSRVRAEEITEGLGLTPIPPHRAQAVGMEMTGASPGQPRHPEGPRHRQAEGLPPQPDVESIGGVARRMPEDLAEDRHPAAPGVFELLEDEHRCPLAQHHPAPVAVEGSAPRRRIVGAEGHLLALQGMDRLHGVDARAGRPGKHHVGGVALDRHRRLPDGDMPTGLAEGQRVARATEIVVDRDVAGGHVGEILEQPERIEQRHAVDRPTIELEGPVGASAIGDPGGEVLREREHVVRPEHAPEPLRDTVRP